MASLHRKAATPKVSPVPRASPLLAAAGVRAGDAPETGSEAAGSPDVGAIAPTS